jgi:hypothetical protein
MSGAVIRGDVQWAINCIRNSNPLFRGGGESDEQVCIIVAAEVRFLITLSATADSKKGAG